jgi:acid phosphatase type 7
MSECHSRRRPAALLVSLAACSDDSHHPTGPTIRLEPLSARTQAAHKVHPVVLAGAGAISSCSNSNDQATAKLLDAVVAANSGATIFTAGDNVYDTATAANYTNCYQPTWGRHKARTRPVIGGNEITVITDVPGGPTYDYFNSFPDQAGPRGKGYYSYDVGAWHIVVLNTGAQSIVSYAKGLVQELWLKDDLAANTKRCTLAIWHSPQFFSRESGATVSVARKALWGDRYAAGAEIVINGDKHRYERFKPQTPDQVVDLVRGIRESIVGTAGRA